MTACFIGHRKISCTEKFYIELKNLILYLIDKEKTDTFLFGSRSEFDSICLKAVTELKAIRPNIKRIYVRAEYPYISDSYMSQLLSYYDDTYMPTTIMDAGRAIYIQRNKHMIDRADICVFYYKDYYKPPTVKSPHSNYKVHQPNSGTKIAYTYAVNQKKEIINTIFLDQ